MKAGNYTPALDPATLACREKLSWWRDAEAVQQKLYLNL